MRCFSTPIGDQLAHEVTVSGNATRHDGLRFSQGVARFLPHFSLA
jgi:hypothetical protein